MEFYSSYYRIINIINQRIRPILLVLVLRGKGYWVDRIRAVEIGGLLRDSLDLIYRIEENDPQYIAVKRLVEKTDCGLAAVSIIANALVSYQLTSRGELYWSMFSEWMSSRAGSSIYYLLQAHREFLLNTRYNRMGLEAKLKRLEKFYTSSLAGKLQSDPLEYCSRLEELWGKIASILDAPKYSKTIVFSVKMYYYVCRACGSSVNGNTPVPVDRRVAYVTLSSCLVRGCIGSLKKCSYDLMKPSLRRLVIDAWNIVSIESGIPGYNLDSLLWVLGRFISGRASYNVILEEVVREYPALTSYSEKLKAILKEFTRCRESLGRA